MILTLGQYLRVGRENAGLSIGQVELMLKLGQGTISRYERGVITPKYERLCELMKLYQYGDDKDEVIAAWQKRQDIIDSKRPEAGRKAMQNYLNRIKKRG